MDRNLILAFALSFLVLTLWMMLQGGPTTPPVSPPGGISESDAGGSGNRVEQGAAQKPTQSVVEKPQLQKAPATGIPERHIAFSTPLYEVDLTTRGGAIRGWRLRNYVNGEVAGHPLVELATFPPDTAVGLTTPFAELGIGDLRDAQFLAERPTESTVVFTHAADGVTVRKIYDFSGDSYLFRLRLEVENRSSRTLSPTFEVLWPVWTQTGSDFLDHALVALHGGAVAKTPLASLGQPGMLSRAFGNGAGQSLRYSGDLDWAGTQTRYFLTAILPDLPKEASAEFAPVVPGEQAVASIAFAAQQLPPAQTLAREYRAYFGPKEPERLDAVGASLERSIDLGYSWIAPLTRSFLWLLHACHAVIPNYGVAIILLTVFVRVATAPLSARQMRSMKRMNSLQPKVRALQEQFKDDRQKQSQEMMKLYRENGVNPLGGCLPILLQFPVFVGLYYALQSSIDLRQAPFVGWIHDLSAPETLFTIPGVEIPLRLLPIIMGGSMILQQKLTPTTMDPAQARMMMTVMPVMFTFLFYQFPSGLVLYWLVSNLLAVGHQVWVNRSPAAKV